MSMDAYERVVLDQIEAGLQLDSWRPGFHRLERRQWYQRRPILFACLVWFAATLATMSVLGLLSLALGGFALALVTTLVVLGPALAAAAYLTARERSARS